MKVSWIQVAAGGSMIQNSAWLLQ
jgi:hypothetical protein